MISICFVSLASDLVGRTENPSRKGILICSESEKKTENK